MDVAEYAPRQWPWVVATMFSFTRAYVSLLVYATYDGDKVVTEVAPDGCRSSRLADALTRDDRGGVCGDGG